MSRANYVKISGKLEGADDLIAELNAVGLSVKGTTRKGVRAGMKAMQVNAERRASSLSTRRGKATKIAISSKSRGSVTGKLGPSKKKFYLRFLETGARPHIIPQTYVRLGRTVRRRLRHPGMAARPWLRPAFDESTTAARQAFGAAMRQAIETRRAQLDNGPDEE
jgi:HK97 gp10 family phage protein